MSNFLLGKGLSSLIPKKITAEPIAKEVTTETIKTKKESVFNIEVDRIKPNPNQPRQKFYPETLQELASSIKEHGILQPLLVNKVIKETERGQEAEYYIIAGERRWRAAQMVGLTSVPVIIRDNTEQERLEMSLIENIQRENLNPIETGIAYRTLMKDYGLKQKEMSSKLGKSIEAISNKIRLLDLPEKIQDYIRQGKLTEGHGRALLTARPERRFELSNLAIENHWSVRKLEDEARETGVFTITRQNRNFKEPFVVNIEKKLTGVLGTRVTVRSRENAGRLMINFYSRKELEALYDKMSKLEQAN